MRFRGQPPVALEGPSFNVTEPGGDGLAIWRLDGETFSFCLWEIKKDSSKSHVSQTISLACRQLTTRAEKYLAKYTGIGSRQHEGELGRFYGQILDMWVDDDPSAGAGVSIGTCYHKAPKQRSFTGLSRAFPNMARDGRLEGLIAYSTETDQAFHTHADQPFHVMPIRSERSDALGFPS